MSDEAWAVRLAQAQAAEFFPAIELAASALFTDQDDLPDFDPNDLWTAEEHRKFIARGHCLTAISTKSEGGKDDENRVIGFLASQPFGRELHIWEMDVLPEFQQQGIGEGLLRACIIDARNAGFAALTLTTFHDLNWNGPFYQRLGFVEVTDLDSHPRLKAELEDEHQHGLPCDRRYAMIQFLS